MEEYPTFFKDEKTDAIYSSIIQMHENDYIFESLTQWMTLHGQYC